MPAGAGGMAATMGGGGGANQIRRPKGSKHQSGKLAKSKKRTAPKHNRGFNLYGAQGGKGSTIQSKRRGKKPFSPAKARNIG